MKITKLYLETSVFGFHFDRREVNRSKRDATQRLFVQVRDGIFEGYAGAATVLNWKGLKTNNSETPCSTCSTTLASRI